MQSPLSCLSTNCRGLSKVALTKEQAAELQLKLDRAVAAQETIEKLRIRGISCQDRADDCQQAILVATKVLESLTEQQ